MGRHPPDQVDLSRKIIIYLYTDDKHKTITTESRERIVLTELTVKQAKENRELAQGRYAAGVGNTIEVTDALTLEINTKTAHISALSDYHLAVASLEKAFGVSR